MTNLLYRKPWRQFPWTLGALLLLSTASWADKPPSLADLPEPARTWAQWSLEAIERDWDAEAGMLGGRGNHSSRLNAQYALALLLRDTPGDAERACSVMEKVLACQFNTPETPYHGTYKRSPKSDVPPESPIVWKDYDPNWREFIGTIQILMLHAYEPVLPSAFVAQLDQALRLAAEGAHARAVAAEYTNISVMSAYLLGYAGQRFGVAEWRRHSETLAREIFENFQVHETFDEYNSPTYYGVNFYGLALWRRYPLSEDMERMGRALEVGLWRDVARFYHAGMKNLCGPFDRSYGMDMRRYVTLLGAWIAFHVPVDAAPLPKPAQGAPKSFEFGTLPAYAMLYGDIPDDVRPGLLAFTGERTLARPIGHIGSRVATAWIGEEVMAGGGATRELRKAWKQDHPATVHWKIPGGEVGWIRFVAGLPARATASKGQLDIACPLDVPAKRPRTASFLIACPDISSDRFTASQWDLPGLKVTVDTNAGKARVEKTRGHLSVTYEVPQDGALRTLSFSLKLNPTGAAHVSE